MPACLCGAHTRRVGCELYQSVVSTHRLSLCAFLVWSACNKAQFIDATLLLQALCKSSPQDVAQTKKSEVYIYLCSSAVSGCSCSSSKLPRVDRSACATMPQAIDKCTCSGPALAMLLQASVTTDADFDGLILGTTPAQIPPGASCSRCYLEASKVDAALALCRHAAHAHIGHHA